MKALVYLGIGLQPIRFQSSSAGATGFEHRVTSVKGIAIYVAAGNLFLGILDYFRIFYV